MSVKRGRESSNDLSTESAEPPRSKMLAFSPSPNDPNHMKVAPFLEKCYNCKKLLAANAEIYMYSNFCAFCSLECRDFQMDKDQKAAMMKQAESSKK